MIFISSIVYLICFLIFVFVIRFGNMLVILIELFLIGSLFIYSLLYYRKRYISYKYILFVLLLSLIEFGLFLLLDRFDLIIYSSSKLGALNSVLTILYFFIIDIIYIILLFSCNLIKYLFKKLKGCE